MLASRAGRTYTSAGHRQQANQQHTSAGDEVAAHSTRPGTRDDVSEHPHHYRASCHDRACTSQPQGRGTSSERQQDPATGHEHYWPGQSPQCPTGQKSRADRPPFPQGRVTTSGYKEPEEYRRYYHQSHHGNVPSFAHLRLHGCHPVLLNWDIGAFFRTAPPFLT